MMVTCMNDPGPIPDRLHAGQFINDPYYNPQYSVFCYENPFMPGDAAYLDTPVVPVSAFAEGYNPPDCAYPDTTPMIKSVLGDAIGGNANAKGPWVSLAGHSLTINAVGDQVVPDHAYSGPAASTAPYNQKTVTRHYGFGTGATVTIGGVAATCSGSDLQMTCTVPPTVPLCNVAQPSGPKCGELVVRAANGRQSIDAITVTVGGKTPTFVPGPNTTNNAIQNAIDSAAPGDLIIVGCAGPVGTTPAQTSCIYNEMVIMWQPVQLQGIGDGAVTLNANTHPAGKLLEPWRRKVNCLFGLALNGGFINNNASATNPNGTSAYNPYDPNGAFPTEFPSGECPFYGSVTGLLTTQSIVDPLMLEPVVGWDATLNGNIAELLQEPTLMGAYEGGGITVVAKGLENNNTANCNPIGNVGCIPLNALTGTTTNNGFNNGLGDCNPSSLFYRSNFLCNRSRIDGLTITNSSQGGGGIFVHGWAHNLEIANTHVTANGGTLTGGITIGQMETADPTLVGTVAQALAVDTHVNVHHNSVTSNAAYGDELNSNTPASAGGVTFCTGSDNYRFNFNWVCGNWSSGDGGGFSHHGFIWNGEIGNNWFVFNQSINPSLVTNGGGVAVLGAAPDGATPTINCENAAVDFDCPPALSDGTGPGLRIHDNVFQGNTSEEGSGGGLALLHVNGNDILNNPSTPGTCRPGTTDWYCVSITNNIFANNVAGWTGGAVSLLDAVVVNFTNNTVASNDSTASAGVVFDSLGTPNGNIPAPGNPRPNGTPCDPNNNPSCTGSAVTTSQIQPAGLVTEHHSANLARAFTNPSVVCPAGHALCTAFSNPVLANDIFWQNRSFYITAAPVVQLNPVLSQGTTGACTGTGSPTYWDIGVYNDTSATNHQSGLTLTPTHSIITSGYNGNGNRSANPGFGAQYCNGSRVPPEIAPALCSGTNGHANAQGCIQPGTVGVSMTVPGGVPDSLTPPLPAFTLTPAATIDEGSNWINMFYGPLSLSNATLSHTTNTPQTPLGNYNHTGASGANLAPPYPNQ